MFVLCVVYQLFGGVAGNINYYFFDVILIGGSCFLLFYDKYIFIYTIIFGTHLF